jgi:hypothetical protein
VPVQGYLFGLEAKAGSATPFDQRFSADGTLIHFSAVPVRFVPALSDQPVTSGPYFTFPEHPNGPAGSSNLYSVRVETILPEGTQVDEQTVATGSEGEVCCPPVRDGQLKLRIANNTCTRDGTGGLVGSVVEVRLTVDPISFAGTGGPVGGPAGQGAWPQSPVVLAILGARFERVSGDQVESSLLGNRIVAIHTYRLPAATCTHEIIGGGQVPVTP